MRKDWKRTRAPSRSGLTTNSNRISTDAILFDLDGTLVDESESYREAIRWTAAYLLDEPVSADEVGQVKRIPGFNQDWDATWGLVRWRRDGVISLPTSVDRHSPEYARLQDVFQTYYLGDDSWRRLSGHPAPFLWDDPLICRERPLISPQTLSWLRHFVIGIATSRPRAEALMAVRQQQLDAAFPDSAIVAVEDCSVGKPDAMPLRLLATRLGCRRPIYVGDTINDALAATAAGMPFIWITPDPSVSPEVAPHARFTLASVDELPRVVSR